MKVLVYPADEYGCGFFRMTWPAEAAARAGCDVEVVRVPDRKVEFVVKGNDTVVDVKVPADADVIVFQRTTHFYLRQAIPLLRSRGIAVVIDVDDDMTLIHPDNPAFKLMHPSRFNKPDQNGNRHMHSWTHLTQACADATYVTATSPEILRRYAGHGRGHVIPNYLPDHYYGHERVDSDGLVWPASLHSHPNDPAVVGNAVARLVDEGATFTTYGEPWGTARAFSLREAPHEQPTYVSIDEWPASVARHGIGIAPLADTKFNSGKSWLKPLEMSAAGVPWVGSPRTEYQRLHRMGAGLMADKPRQWYRLLSELRADERRRKEVSDAGREVAAQLRLENHAWRWIEAWETALKIARS